MRGAPGLLALLFVSSVLAGCLGGDEAAPVPQEPAPEAPAAPNPEWGTLTFSATGALGDWVLVHQPLPPEATEAGHTITGSLTLDEDGVALVVAPDMILDVATGIAFLHDGPFLATTAGTIPFDRVGTGAASEAMRGFVFGVGATVPWKLDVTITLEAGGPESETALVVRGNGTVATTAPATAGTGAPAGQVAVALATDGGGWTHLGLVLDRVQPSGVHQVDASFASGHTFSRQGAAARVATPDWSGGGATGYFTDIGTTANGAGDNALSATFADLATSAMAAAVHLPGADTWQPEGLEATAYAVGR